MNSRLHRLSLLQQFIFPILLTLSSLLYAQDPAPKETKGFKPLPNNKPLVISHGVIQDERKTPATVQNLVSLIREIYRQANITVLAVDDIVVGDLTLQWQGHVRPESQMWENPPLEGVLTTLCLASDRKFVVNSFGPNNFVLRLPDPEDRSTRRVTEIFNMSSLMKQNYRKAHIEADIQRTEAELSVLRSRYGEKNPRVTEGMERIDIFKAQLAQAAPAEVEVEKLVTQLRELLTITLSLKSRDQLPEFKFHTGTNLLVVIGSQETVDATRKVIAALEKTP